LTCGGSINIAVLHGIVKIKKHQPESVVAHCRQRKRWAKTINLHQHQELLELHWPHCKQSIKLVACTSSSAFYKQD